MPNNRPRRRVETTRRKSFDFNIADPLANWINKKLEIDERLSTATLRKTMWVMFLILVYIFFQHNFDSLIRKLNKTERQVNEQRAAYISFKSSYMFASKQSEVEKKLENRGFEKSKNPPIKISANEIAP
jgi:chromosome condensin MukBEF ATPase and DNA-binding subunit MukB